MGRMHPIPFVLEEALIFCQLDEIVLCKFEVIVGDPLMDYIKYENINIADTYRCYWEYNRFG